MNCYYAVIKIDQWEEVKFVYAFSTGDLREYLYSIGATQIISIQKI